MPEPLSTATATANDGSAASACEHNAVMVVQLAAPSGIDIVTTATLTLRVRRVENGNG